MPPLLHVPSSGVRRGASWAPRPTYYSTRTPVSATAASATLHRRDSPSRLAARERCAGGRLQQRRPEERRPLPSSRSRPWRGPQRLSRSSTPRPTSCSAEAGRLSSAGSRRSRATPWWSTSGRPGARLAGRSSRSSRSSPCDTASESPSWGSTRNDNDDDAREFLERYPVSFPSYKDPDLKVSAAMKASRRFRRRPSTTRRASLRT